MTRVGDYCFNMRVLAWFGLGAAAVLLFAPSVLQAAVLLIVGSCPVTTVAGVCKAARFHVCLGDDQQWQPEPVEPEPLAAPGPYANLVAGMFGRRK